MEKDIYVFFVEDKILAQKLITSMSKDTITYCQIFPGNERLYITDALDKIEAQREYETE